MVIENKLNNTNENEQLNALKQGFYEIIPQNISSILDEIDLKVNKLYNLIHILFFFLHNLIHILFLFYKSI